VKLLARYVLGEVLVPLAVWVVFFFFLFLAMSFLRGTELLLGSAVSAGDLLAFIGYLTPHFLQQALPIAFLLAILLGLGRLSEDGELTALRALGVGPWRLLVWPMSLALGLGALSLAVACTLEPWGMRAVTRSANELIKRNLMGDVRPEVFYDELPDLVLYTERVRSDGAWENVLIHDGRDHDAPVLLLAQKAHIEPQTDRDEIRLLLNGGSLHRSDPLREGYALADFAHGALLLGVEGAMGKNTFRRPHEELTPGELLEAAASSESPLPFLVTFHSRLGRTLMPLAFALFATPFAFGARGSRRRGFLLSIGAYVLYYVVMQVGAGLGAKGHLSPAIAGELANVLFAGLGCWAMVRANREGAAR
jgi:lipopolysaccharide export system permease protein